MENELDFNNLKLEDVSVGGQPLATPDPAAQSAAQNNTPSGSEPASTPSSTPDQGQSSDPAPTSDSGYDVDWSKANIVYSGGQPSYKDDFIKGAVDYYEKTGDLSPYLQAKLVDFKGMSDEDVMRRNLREQYPEVSDKAFDRLFKQQIIDKYKLDAEEWGEEDSELGRELLKVEAEKARQNYIKWQDGFKAPEPVGNPAPKAQDEEVQLALQQFEQTVKSNPLTNQILNDKRIAIKVGDAEFNYEIQDADSMVGMTLDNSKFFQQFAQGDGQLDYSKWYKTAAYSQNPELFEKALINYGKTLGREEVTKAMKNPSSNNTGDVPTEGSGDFSSGLLEAFSSRGIHK